MDDNRTIAIPDRRGNNRIDTLTNIVTNPSVGTIFFIPGVAEVMRVNGDASIHDDPNLCAEFEVKGKQPATVILVEARENFSSLRQGDHALGSGNKRCKSNAP